MLGLLVCGGPLEVFFIGYMHDYNRFMRTTDDSADLVQQERDAVTRAFGAVSATYRAVGFVRDSGFAEASTEFERILNESVSACRKKGVRAETSLEEFFRL